MFKDLPDEEMQLQHLLTIDSFMREQGFDHYEISNFARIKPAVPKEQFRALHNMRTWQGKSYLGLGPSAHSFDGEARARFKNISSLHAYARKLASGELATEWREVLTPEQERLETWMLRLRLADGVERAFIESEGKTSRANKLIEQGFLREHPEHASRLQLTPRGLALSDQVIQFLV
jgi:oxygen-independent coproporphyrinogen-3 oxidase